ncbi:MAG: amidohydrolase [Vicingaceae bacterium]
MDKLKITIVQTHLHWENIEKNLNHFSQLLDSLNPTDVVVLPEMFTTGFTMNAEKVAENLEGKAFKWLKETAQQKKAVVTGSIVFKEQNNFYNRLFWVQPDGTYQTYDKRHLFSFAGEDQHYTAGKNRLITQYKGWRFCPLICYDLRFPVFSRNFKNKTPLYDCLIYVANWPEVRVDAWSTLLKARAIENQCYVIGVNRIGNDQNNIQYSGHSVVIDPKGNTLSKTQPHQESVETITIDLSTLNDFREKFPVANDSDDFELIG